VKIHPYDGRFDRQIKSLTEAIQYKMAVHSDKGQWNNLNVIEMLKQLADEVDELREAIQNDNVLEAIHECGDIGVYAVMIIECLMRGRSLKDHPDV